VIFYGTARLCGRQNSMVFLSELGGDSPQQKVLSGAGSELVDAWPVRMHGCVLTQN